MVEHFNELTPAQDERLALLAEECAEVIQAITKIQRHGYESYNPLDNREHRLSNRQALEKEIGHVRHAIGRLIAALDVTTEEIDLWSEHKAGTINRWLHHQLDEDEPKPPLGSLQEEIEAVPEEGER